MTDPDSPVAVLPPPAFLAGPAVRAVLAALPGARAVGGCVRDALADRPVHDVDVAAPLPPDAIAGLLRAAGLRVFDTGLAHGTVTAVLERQPVEVTALRRDVATDGRHAAVEWTTDWREDSGRRDFTINALSLDAAGRLWDYHGGRADLTAGRVRFVGDPATRLAEDYLRVLRFFRFQARYGRGAPDPEAVAAIRAAVPGLARLSAERVWTELARLLALPDPVAALELMRATGVLEAVLPEAARLDRLATLVRLGAPAEALLRLAAVLAPAPDAAAREATLRELGRRLRLSGRERTELRALAAPGDPRDRAGPTGAEARLGPSPAPDPAELRRALWSVQRAVPEPGGQWVLARRAWLAEASPCPAAAGDAAGWGALRARIAATAPPTFPLAGRDVLAEGVAPGPCVGRLLSGIVAWWWRRGCADPAEACRARLRDLLGRLRRRLAVRPRG